MLCNFEDLGTAMKITLIPEKNVSGDQHILTRMLEMKLISCDRKHDPSSHGYQIERGTMILRQRER